MRSCAAVFGLFVFAAGFHSPALSCPFCHPSENKATGGAPPAASPSTPTTTGTAVRAPPPAVTHTIVVALQGMTCDGCASSIKRELATQRGVIDADVLFASATARITYDPSVTSPSTLASVIKQMSHRGEKGAFTVVVDDKTKPEATARLSVTGMTCAACAKGLDAALKKLEGVKRTDIAVATGAVVVSYDPEKTTPSSLLQAVKAAGYGAALALPSAAAVTTKGG